MTGEIITYLRSLPVFECADCDVRVAVEYPHAVYCAGCATPMENIGPWKHVFDDDDGHEQPPVLP